MNPNAEAARSAIRRRRLGSRTATLLPISRRGISLGSAGLSPRSDSQGRMLLGERGCGYGRPLARVSADAHGAAFAHCAVFDQPDSLQEVLFSLERDQR